ncbi:MAG: glycosyltransferase family 4 protein, partial [Chloroflexota bacterium]
DPSHRLDQVYNALYDRWAAAHIEPADLFFVWAGFALRSLSRARQVCPRCVVQCASAHPRYQWELMRKEYGRWGVPLRVSTFGLERTAAEFALADRVLVPSEFAWRTFLACGHPPDRLLLSPFGVDAARFRPAAPRGERPFTVLFLGRVALGKGIPYLLEAWRRLGWRDAELRLVGAVQADYAAAFRGMVAGLPGVRVVGHVADPVPHYQQADLFAFPTLHEGSALVALEALACGLPVVTTDNAGSAVRDGQEGLIVPIRDAEALAAALDRLRADVPLRAAMSDAARQRAEAYTWERSEEAFVRALADLLPDAGLP